MPKIDRLAAPGTEAADCPGDLAEPFRARRRTRLGDAAGITAFGRNLITRPPGAVSSLRHWHEVEEEMVSVLSGDLTLVDDTGETPLGPGDAAGFPGGVAHAHPFVNQGTVPATSLEIGPRPRQDRCHSAEHDLAAHDADGRTWYTRRDGTPFTEIKERFE